MLDTISILDLVTVAGGTYGGVHPLTDDEVSDLRAQRKDDAEANKHRPWLQQQQSPEPSILRCGSLWSRCNIGPDPR